MKKGLLGSQIAAILKESNLPAIPSVHGYEVSNGWPDRVRLERCSGIAGRGSTWRLRDVRTGAALSEICENATSLRRALLEWMALDYGPKPTPGINQEVYARWNHNRFGSHVVWVTRKRKNIGGSDARQ